MMNLKIPCIFVLKIGKKVAIIEDNVFVFKHLLHFVSNKEAIDCFVEYSLQRVLGMHIKRVWEKT